MKKFISTLLILCGLNTFAQQEKPLFPLPKDIIPVSPTASALGQYGASIIDNYSGTANLSIPIFNLETGSLSIPISLSYNSSGVRVEDIASWVGLGWSLNAGGVISVNVMGLPDLQKPKATLINQKSLLNYNFPSDQYVYSAFSKQYDYQPDIFNYNFCGFSGQFVLDENLKVHSLKNSNGLLFTCDISQKKITATDNVGRTYIFDILEKTIRTTQRASFDVGSEQFFNFGFPETDLDSTITALFLSKIVLENSKGEILFSYNKDLQKYYTRPNGSLNTSFSPYQPCQINYQTMYWDGGYDVLYKSFVTNKTWRLSAIDFNRANIHVKFFSDLNRQDIFGTKALTKIVVHSKDTISSWELKYFYLLSPFEKYENNGIGNSSLHKRLALKEVVKYNVNNKNDYTSHILNYYGELDSELGLRMPYRTSCDGYDHWGYFNGSFSQSSSTDPRKLFPVITSPIDIPSTFAFNYGDGVRKIENYPTMPAFTWGGNRNPNGLYSKAFSLKSIIYPTKGQTNFDYEANTYTQVANNTYSERTGPGIRIKSIKNIEGASEIVKNYFYSGGVILQEPYYVRSLFQSINHNGTCFNDLYSSEPKSFYSGGYVISTNSMDNILSFISNQIGYAYVEESQPGNGKTCYYYITPNDSKVDYSCRFAYKQNSIDIFHIWNILSLKPVFPFAGGFFRPMSNIQMLKKKQIFNSKNVKLKEQLLTYKMEYPDTVYTYDIYSDNQLYLIKFLPIISNKSFNDSIIDMEYFNKDTIIQITRNEYDSQTELLISNEIQSRSEISKTTIKYPFSYNINSSSTNVLKLMKDKNIVRYPTEIVNYKNNNVISASLVTYKTSNNINFYPYSFHNLSVDAPLTNFVNSTISSNQLLTMDSRYFIEKTFDNFDYYGNILQITNKGKKESFLWGYNYSYPIAKADNASSMQISHTSFEDATPITGSGYYGLEWTCGYSSIYNDKSKTGKNCIEIQGSTINSIKTFPAGKYYLSLWAMNKPGYSGGTITVNGQSIEPYWPGSTWRYNERIITLSTPQTIFISSTGNILIDELRIYPIDAQMTTYTYDPLVGMTSQTDPNGITTYYEYDGLGRLHLVKDHEGNILKRYDYQYAK